MLRIHSPSQLTEPSRRRYASLDIWRGIACLAVVVFHASYYSPPTPGVDATSAMAAIAMRICSEMWIGVPMFFVISGYCIAATADSARARSEPLYNYFQRRFRRIYPPYWALLLMTISVVAICEGVVSPGLFGDGNHPIPAPWTLSPWQWIGNFTLTETWRPNLAGESAELFLGHAWTLCYEEQFYIVCGLILLIAPRRFFLAATLITVAVFPMALIAHKFHCRGFFFDGFWVTFASGIFVYFHANYASSRTRRTIECVLAVGMGCCWADPLHHWKFASIEQQGFVAFGFALVLIALRRWDQRIAESPVARPLRSCGLMSYSLYLVHWPITKAISHMLFLAGLESNVMTILVTIPACLATSLLAAWPFHILVERRFLNPKGAVAEMPRAREGRQPEQSQRAA